MRTAKGAWRSRHHTSDKARVYRKREQRRKIRSYRGDQNRREKKEYDE